jgi:AcrR family transcriptional regulator
VTEPAVKSDEGASVTAKPRARRLGRPVNANGAETRERLMRLALKSLVSTGLDGMNLEDVARDAGLTRAAIYRYFDSKMDLARAAVLRHLPTFDAVESYVEESQAPAPTLGGQVRALVTACLRSATESREAARAYYAVASMADMDPGIGEAYRSISMFVRNRLFKIVSDAIGRGELPADFDCMYIVDGVAGQIWALGQASATSPSARVTRQLQLAAELFVRGAFWDSIPTRGALD